MWNPADKYALPSPQDLTDARNAIHALENELRDSKEHSLEIERDLEERRAWIAPIRKLPMEILSDILLRVSEAQDLAPLAFTSVSRLWRSVIFSTPKAWSFIELHTHYERHLRISNQNGYDGYFPGYASTYLECSRQCVLHLYIPKIGNFHPQYSIPIIKDHAHRIRCLTVATDLLVATQSTENCQKFPNLETLFLTGLGHGDQLDTSFYDVARFPVLRNLHWPQCYLLTEASPSLSSVNFPPLQHLSLEIGSFCLWEELLQRCSATLRTMRVGSMRRNNSHSVSISFPLLHSLAITSGSSSNPPYVKATTPVLASLIIDDESGPVPTFFEIKADTVAHLRWCGLKRPFPCPAVRVLQIEVLPGPSSEYAKYAHELRDIVSAYPMLQTIEISLGKPGNIAGLDRLREGVEKHLSDGVKDILLWTETWRIELPEYTNWIQICLATLFDLRRSVVARMMLGSRSEKSRLAGEADQTVFCRILRYM